MNEDILIVPAGPADIEGVEKLMFLKPPMAWIKRGSPGHAKTFLEYSVDSHFCVMLVAHPHGNSEVAGYVLSVFDSNRFWQGFSLRNPVTMTAIMYHRLRRICSLNVERRRRLFANGNDAHLPFFSWSSSGPETARIIGIYVNQDYRRQGIATQLYLKLFDTLRAKGCLKVEEYMGPDYFSFAGKFPETLGWHVQQLRDAGYKITKSL